MKNNKSALFPALAGLLFTVTPGVRAQIPSPVSFTILGKGVTIDLNSNRETIKEVLRQKVPTIKIETDQAAYLQAGVKLKPDQPDIWITFEFHPQGNVKVFTIGGYDPEHCPQVAEISEWLGEVAGGSELKSPDGTGTMWRHAGWTFIKRHANEGNDNDYNLQVGKLPTKVGIGILINAAAGGGARVDGVEKVSPAQKAGLLVGDVISEFNGTMIKNGEDFIGEMRKVEPGTECPLTVKRGGKTVVLKVTPQVY